MYYTLMVSNATNTDALTHGWTRQENVNGADVNLDQAKHIKRVAMLNVKFHITLNHSKESI